MPLNRRITENKPKFTFGVKESRPQPTRMPTQPAKRVPSQNVESFKPLKQSGTVKNLQQDSQRSARMPGKRISKSGKVYWETRKNRSDAVGKTV